MRRSILLGICLLFLSFSPARSETAAGAVANPGFEEGEAGQAPSGWKIQPVSVEGGYTVRVVEDHPESGRRCLEISLPGTKKNPQVFGASSQTIDAAPYRGKRVRFSAAVRVEGAGADGAALWLRVDRPDGGRGFFDNMRDRPVTASAWARVQITGEVAPDAQKIQIGFMLPERGRAWFDSALLEVLGEAGAGNEPARALTGRGLDNLAAFANLYGVVRWFHPSDQAAAADWTALALAGVQRAEKAADAVELARTLEDLFRPVAPTVRVFPTGSIRQPPAPPEALKRPAGAVRRVAWRHLGVSLNSNPNSAYHSTRVDDQGVPTGGMMSQEIEAAPFRGRKVRLRAAVRAELPAGQAAHLTLQSFQAGGKKGAAAEVSIPAGPWRTVEATGEVPADSAGLLLTAGLDHTGKVWVDDVALETLDTEAKAADPHAVLNPSFEEGNPGWPPDGWDLLDEAAAGYALSRSDEQPRPPQGGTFSALLASPDPQSLVPAAPDEPYLADLGGGVSALVPLSLWADAAGTLPHIDKGVLPPKPDKPETFLPSGDDRATRLADVVIAWNVFEHFYPYFDVAAEQGAAWPAVLRSSLREAAADADATAFTATVRRLVAALHDGHGFVNAGAAPLQLGPPIAWDWVEDRLVVTWADPEKSGGLRPGDAVRSIDGKPAREVLEAAMALLSGATPQWRRTRALTEIAVGTKDREMKLEVEPLDGPARTVTLQRTAPLYGPGSAAEARQKALPEKIAEVRPGIFYVDLSRITDDDFRGALDKLAAAKGVVFDLRGYPRQVSPAVLRHLTDRPLHSAQWQIPVFTRPHQQGVTWDKSHWTLPPLPPRLPGKIAFLTGGGAISYAESYMGIVEAYHLAAIVGGPTAGTNGNINPFTLPGGYSVTWTGMKVLKHDGSRHHGVGIQPTVPVAPTRRGIAAGKDEVLEKGIAEVSAP